MLWIGRKERPRVDERRGGSEQELLVVKCNLGVCYSALGRHEAALDLRREVYDRNITLEGLTEDTLVDASNLSLSLVDCDQHAEAKRFLRNDILPTARRILRPVDSTMLELRVHLAIALFKGEVAPLEDLIEAKVILEDVVRTARRVFGDGYPDTEDYKDILHRAQAKLARARAM